MSSPNPYSFAVKVRHPFRDAKEIADRLCLVATHSNVAGQPRVTPTGQPLDGVYAETYCCFYVNVPEQQQLDESLCKANAFLAKDRLFVRRLRNEGARFVYSVSFQPGYSAHQLEPETLAAMAKLGVELALSVYEVRQLRGRRVENFL